MVGSESGGWKGCVLGVRHCLTEHRFSKAVVSLIIWLVGFFACSLFFTSLSSEKSVGVDSVDLVEVLFPFFVCA